MADTLQAPYSLNKAEDIENLPDNSVVIVKDSEHGDHMAFQYYEDKKSKCWVSIFFGTEHDAEDLINFSYNGEVLVVYVHPGK